MLSQKASGGILPQHFAARDALLEFTREGAGRAFGVAGAQSVRSFIDFSNAEFAAQERKPKSAGMRQPLD